MLPLNGRLVQDEVVQAGEQARLGELAHPGEEGEPDVRVAIIHDRVQTAQKVTIGGGCLRRVEHIEDGFVVLLDQGDDTLSGAPVQRLQQAGETSRRGVPGNW